MADERIMRALLEKQRFFPDLARTSAWEREPELYQGEIRNDVA